MRKSLGLMATILLLSLVVRVPVANGSPSQEFNYVLQFNGSGYQSFNVTVNDAWEYYEDIGVLCPLTTLLIENMTDLPEGANASDFKLVILLNENQAPLDDVLAYSNKTAFVYDFEWIFHGHFYNETSGKDQNFTEIVPVNKDIVVPFPHSNLRNGTIPVPNTECRDSRSKLIAQLNSSTANRYAPLTLDDFSFEHDDPYVFKVVMYYLAEGDVSLRVHISDGVVNAGGYASGAPNTEPITITEDLSLQLLWVLLPIAAMVKGRTRKSWVK